MTLWQLSQEYARSADLIAGRVARLRQEEAETGDEAQRLVLRRRLPDAMADLTTRQQQMVRLRYGEKLSVTDIALRLGVNKSTVSRCLRRARQQLYRRLRFAL